MATLVKLSEPIELVAPSRASRRLAFNRRVLSAAISVALLAGTIYLVMTSSNDMDLSHLWETMTLSAALCITAALCAGVFLATGRMKLISSGLGFRLSWIDATTAFSAGSIGGAIFFQIAGQVIGRNIILTRRGVPVTATIIITGIERAFALAVSLCLAVIAAIYLNGSIGHDFSASNGYILTRLAIGMSVVLISCLLFCWRGSVGRFRPNAAGVARTAAIFFISIATQLATMLAYFIAARAFAPDIAATQLLAAILIIMFAASIPISFAGWGVRELSAVAAFGMIGMSPVASFTVAATIGILSIVAAGVIGAIASRFFYNTNEVHAVASIATSVPTIDKAIGPLCGAFSFFTIYVPIGNSYTSISASDPIALVGAALLAIHVIMNRRLPRLIDNKLYYFGAAMVIVLTASFFIGVNRFGLTPWALTRMSGLAVIATYFFTGIVGGTNNRPVTNLQSILWGYSVAAATVVILDCIFLVIQHYAASSIPAGFLPRFFSGFSQNRNAFAFALILAFAGSIFIDTWKARAVGAICVFGIILSTSRAGWVCALLLLVTYLMSKRLIQQRYALIIAAAAMAIGVYYIGGSFRWSDKEHLRSMLDAIKLTADYPLFGAGLGAYINTPQPTGLPIVIHSVPLWLLAETGIIGGAIFAASFAYLALSLWGSRYTREASFSLMLIGTAAVFAQAHDILYQRPLWLLLGASLMAVQRNENKNE